ncbi:MAG TPA: 16S rRNA (uracil(1498)-N(3))-methyltransferase [Thermodesulfobacteriaceae bacterium]|nr:16S rRNA (uracil(1498)-N(3))-methyltransferase [Thermodesulfobacteriaceae bacterium]
MSLPRFFAPEIVPGEPCLLSSEEGHHLRDVLRLGPEKRIFLLNGQGQEWEARVLEVAKTQVWVLPENLHRTEPKPDFRLELLMPLLKGGRSEFLVEKATELAATRIIPVLSRYTVVKPVEKIKSRLQKRAIQALKQSGRLWLPEIEAPRKLQESLVRLEASYRYFAYERGGIPLAEVFESFEIFPERLTLAVGPEGGFSEEEVRLFEKFDFEALDLGPYILRAETAVLFLLSVWRYQVLRVQGRPSNTL